MTAVALPAGEERSRRRSKPAGSNNNAAPRSPRLAFLGVGWIGRHRLDALARSGAAEVAVIADPSARARRDAGRLAPDAAQVAALDDVWAHDVDGVVIATPSALHAEQTIAALERGAAVFCQKPLARSAAEARAVIAAARAADRLLGVDLSYRHTRAMTAIRDLVAAGGIGRVFALDLVFHNAYGPDRAWFYDRDLAGGGCVIDLGVHLVDLALWLLGFPAVRVESSQLVSGGRPIQPGTRRVEDYAVIQLTAAGGASVRIACSWKLPAGCDAVIRAEVYGTGGTATLHNVGGSFYDFVADRFSRTGGTRMCEPPDDWGGRAAVQWARRLQTGAGFDEDAQQFAAVATVIDEIYRIGRAGSWQGPRHGHLGRWRLKLPRWRRSGWRPDAGRARHEAGRQGACES